MKSFSLSFSLWSIIVFVVFVKEGGFGAMQTTINIQELFRNDGVCKQMYANGCAIFFFFF